ncbi:MAG: hypothetical protein QM677_02515 [Microbacterium sp.]
MKYPDEWNVIVVATYMYAVRKFKKAARTWLSDEDYPAVIALENVARELDAGNVSPAMIGQFGLAYRALLKRQPAAPATEVDPLDDIIPS